MFSFIKGVSTVKDYIALVWIDKSPPIFQKHPCLAYLKRRIVPLKNVRRPAGRIRRY